MNKRKSLFWVGVTLFLAVLLSVLVLPPVMTIAEEYDTSYDYIIKSYNVDITAHANNTYDIVETIDVRFNQYRHGIYREIPIRYNGKLTPVTQINTFGETSQIKKQGSLMSIRLGDADVTLIGDRQYKISYTLDMGEDDIKDADAIYLNIIGTGWGTKIYKTTFSVDVSELAEVEREITTTIGYSGSTETADVAVADKGTRINGVVLRTLMPYEGVTLYVDMPDGTFVGAKNAFEFRRIFTFGIPLITLVMLIYWVIKYGTKREPVPVIEFYPPMGLNPTEIGYIIDESVDSEDIGALIIYWASKGYLSIQEERFGRFTLIKTGEMGVGHKKYEVHAFNQLWKLGDGQKVKSAELRNNYYTQVNKIRDGAKTSYTYGETTLYKPKAKTASSFVAFMSGLCIGIVGIVGLPLIMGGEGANFAGFFFSLFFIMVPYFFISAWFQRIYDRRHRNKPWVTALLFFLVFALYLVGILICVSVFKDILLTEELAALLLVPLVTMLVRPRIKQYTQFGFDILQRVLGFRRFIETAEEERMEILMAEDKDYIYHILPYAMVLGVSDTWAKKFDVLMSEPPTWYSTHGTGTFTTASLMRSMSRTASTVSSVASSSPSSSGSGGGGGSSGGGGGGGGGGSW